MEAAKKAYEAYEANAGAVKEVGNKLLEMINNNLAAIERYRKNIEEATALGQETSYFERWITELESENQLILEIEQFFRAKYLGDGRRIEL